MIDETKIREIGGVRVSGSHCQVLASENEEAVAVRLTNSAGSEHTVTLSPSAARRLANCLRRIAGRIEARTTLPNNQEMEDATD